MATAQQIKALLESYTDGDRSRFLSVASQISAHAAKTGKTKLSEELRRLIDHAQQSNEQPDRRQTVPIAQPSGELSGLVAATFPKAVVSDLVLPNQLKARLDRVLREYRQADKLVGHGLSPRRRLLLLGPPGCGKSMTASVLAGELHLPLLTVQFHTMITKYMGESAAKLKLVFDMMRERRGVYLFDEFDAIGSHRHTGQDVGEIRRVLNAFLVFIEQDDSRSLIVAASNLESTIDQAVFRRFDDVLKYPMPDDSMARQLIEQRVGHFLPKRFGWKTVLSACSGLSHADIVRACEDVAKDLILDGASQTTARHLSSSLRNRRRME